MSAKRSNQKVTQQKYPMLYLIPLIAVLAVIPALLYECDVNTGLTKYNWYTGSQTTIDFFLYVKAIWLYVTFGVMLFLTFYMVFSEEKKISLHKAFMALLVYGGLCLVAACFSVDRARSFRGIYEQYESVWILLGYVLLTIYAYVHLQEERAVKRLLPWFVAGIVVLTAFGVCQAFGVDPVACRTFQKMFITNSDLIGHVSLKFGKGRTYMTLYNPNYVGFYGVLTIPLLIALFVVARKWWHKMGYAILIAGLFLCVFASQSRAGIIALAAGGILLALLLRKYLFRRWDIAASVIALGVAAFAGVNAYNHNVLITRMQAMFQAEQEKYALTAVETDHDVIFTMNGHELHMTLEGKEADAEVLLTDEKGTKVTAGPADDSQERQVDDPRFPVRVGTISKESFHGFYVVTSRKTMVDGKEQNEQKKWIFTNELVKNDNRYYVVAGGNALFRMKKAKEGFSYLEKHYSLANNRGYIWAKTWNLLKAHPLLGTGPDTFLIAFPNDDLVGLYNSGHSGEMISKPHCLYLQIAAQTGIPSLIAFLTFVLWYVVSSIRLLWNASMRGYLPKIGAALLVSVIGYLIMGLSNDSCIAVAPIFFVLLGMGVAVNHTLNDQHDTEVA